MNLTTPPPVEQLDPEYATDLKYDLVRRARKRKRTRWTPYVAWVPIVAATAAIAISTTTVVALSRSGAPGPAGQPGILQIPADQSPRESLEDRPAGPAEAKAAARKCLTPKPDGLPKHLSEPAQVETASVKSARWIKIPGAAPRLLQTFVTKGDNMWVQCLDGEFLREEGQGDGFADEDGPVPGTWAWSTVTDKSGTSARASYMFRADYRVDRVELRIRGTEDASPWFWVKVQDFSGYVAGVLPGTVAEHGKVEVDVRALDESGKQLSLKTFG